MTNEVSIAGVSEILTAAERGMGLGCVAGFVEGTGVASSSEDESSLNPMAEGPLLAALM